MRISFTDMELPLGFWLETVFNCLNFVSRTESFILKSPPISKEQILFPVKSSSFEDIQQENFWVSLTPEGRQNNS